MQNETKFTPGPWEPKRIESQRWEIDAPNGDPTIGHKLWQGLAAVYGCDDMSAAGAQVAEANAHLIAAAPELYEALESLVDEVTNHGEADGAILDSARAALTKARGEA